jgi:hypothetical protein
MKIEYPKIGVCGLSCALCPTYHSKSDSRCGGCKSEGRMKVGCPFTTCAVKKRCIEFCWLCPEQGDCEKWDSHRKRGQSRDSFVCYQRLEDNIAFVRDRGIPAFAEDQKEREQLLSTMIAEFNEGRSRSFYCVAATVMDIREITQAIAEARDESVGKDIKSKCKVLHAILDRIAEGRKYSLKLRK